MLLFLVDLINIEKFRISLSLFYSFSFILRSRATSTGHPLPSMIVAWQGLGAKCERTVQPIALTSHWFPQVGYDRVQGSSNVMSTVPFFGTLFRWGWAALSETGRENWSKLCLKQPWGALLQPMLKPLMPSATKLCESLTHGSKSRCRSSTRTVLRHIGRSVSIDMQNKMIKTFKNYLDFI